MGLVLLSHAFRDWANGLAYFDDTDQSYHRLAEASDETGPIAPWDVLVKSHYVDFAQFRRAANGQPGGYYPDLDAVQSAAFHRVHAAMTASRPTSDYPIYAPGTSDVIGRRVTVDGTTVDLMAQASGTTVEQARMTETTAETAETFTPQTDPVATAYTDSLRTEQAARGRRRKADGTAQAEAQALDTLLADRGLGPKAPAATSQTPATPQDAPESSPVAADDVPEYAAPVALAPADAPDPGLPCVAIGTAPDYCERCQAGHRDTGGDGPYCGRCKLHHGVGTECATGVATEFVSTGRVARFAPRPDVTETYEYGLYDEDLTFVWDIGAAQMRANGRPVETTGLAILMQFIRDGNAEVDPGRAMLPDIDVSLPILAIPLPYPVGVCIVIDGWHRVYKAAQLGNDEIPIVLLDETDERAIRLAPTQSELLAAHPEVGVTP